MSTEQHRRACEARFWIKHTGGRNADMDEMMARITQRRGKHPADQIRQDMLDQWGMS